MRARWLALLLLALIGCATYPVNSELQQYKPDYGYRFSRYFPSLKEDDTFIILTFSGGGMRASTLAYSVLQELDRTPVGAGKTLLDDVDMISAVSGGSFTAMYYALHGKEGLPWFENNFLRKNIQKDVTHALFRPGNILRMLSPRFSRSDLAAEIYDHDVFHGATYADVLKRNRRPFVIINASELDIGTRFEFTQDQFDRVCSDLEQFPVARAVTASSAVPVVFTPIRLRSYAGQCGYVEPPWIGAALAKYATDPLEYRQAWERHTYLDPQRGALHLVDGGISDNLGLVPAIKAMTSSKGDFNLLDLIRGGKVRRVVVIVVDANFEVGISLGAADRIGGMGTVMNKVLSNQVSGFTFETLGLLHEVSEDMPKPVQVYVVSVGFPAIRDENERAYFNNIPTAFTLENEQIDRLLAIGPKLLKESERYNALLRDLARTSQ